MVPPLAVCAGERLKLPQAPTLPQLAVQFTPRPFGSPVTVAANGICAPAVTVAGGAIDVLTTIGTEVTILAVAVDETAGLLVDRAVMVTVPPAGTAEGP